MNNTPSSHPPGRPSKLTSECVERLARALKAGHTRGTAAALAGIGESTLYAWLAAANRPDAASEYLDFRDAITKAENEGEDALLGIIRAASEKTWQAAAWILERRRPDHWSKRMKAEIAVAPPHAQGTSDVEQHIAEAKREAHLTMEIAHLASQMIPLEDWPEDVREAALQINGA